MWGSFSEEKEVSATQSHAQEQETGQKASEKASSKHIKKDLPFIFNNKPTDSEIA